MGFPTHRLRRLRRTEPLRKMVQQTHLTMDDLVMPIFVRPGKGVHRPIVSMPGREQFSVDLLVEECLELQSLGIPAILLFGIPDFKDARGSRAWADDGIVQKAVRAIKEKCDRLVVITDVCLCEYSDHGHCGVLVERGGVTEVDNDQTLELLAKVALSHAKAGADMVAPSDMMDGRIGRVRQSLDQGGFQHTAIISYAAKFASSFFSPFREAVKSAPKFGDRRGYQLDFHNHDEAMRELEFDIEEGADIIMIKPALAYLDIVYHAKQRFGVPLACYNVSGEYAMLKAAAQNGWLDEPGTVMEALIGMKRAGADIIITYFAKDIAEWLRTSYPVSIPDGLRPTQIIEPEPS